MASKSSKSVPRRTITLPASLRAELVDLGKLPALGKGKSGRKERRKSQRDDGKAARAEHFASKKRKAEGIGEELVEAGGKKDTGGKSEKGNQQPDKKKLKSALVVPPPKPEAAYQTPLEKLLAQQEGKANPVDVKRKRTKVESTEDQEIAWLEAKLGVRNGPPTADKSEKGKWKEEYLEDGLDDLFAGIDELESAAFGDSNKDYKRFMKEEESGSDHSDSNLEDEDEDDSEGDWNGIDEEEDEDEESGSEEFDDDMGGFGDSNDEEAESGAMTASFGSSTFTSTSTSQSKPKSKKSNLESSSESEESDSESESESDSEEDSGKEEYEGMNYDDPWAGMGSGESGDEEGGMTATFDGASFGGGAASIATAPEMKSKKKTVVFDLATASTSTTSDHAAPTRYVPPHMRKAALEASTTSVTSPPSAFSTATTSTTEEPSDPRLRRQILGLLNKLSSTNISSILPAIEVFYSSHPRALVSSTLTSLLLEIISGRDNLGDMFVITYAALVGAISRSVGVEFPAGVIAKSVGMFDEARSKSLAAASKTGEGEGGFEGRPGSKEAENLVGFLSELYNFGVVSCGLIYDLVRLFIESGLGELEVELLVKVVKRAGQQLRQDDPSSLKEIINLVKLKMTGADAGTMNLRTRFMIDALTNLKNNKIKPNADGAIDNYSNLKKYLTGLKRGSGSVPEALRISLADIRSSSSKGKWWIVGAAWGGDPLVDAQKAGGLHKKEIESDAVLAKLARAQGMNTDIRKGVFHVLMSSEDYVDACERLLQLGLTDVQQREIARVLLQCCGNEKTYNPYYTLVAYQMGTKSHGFQITLQYCLWDFLRELGEKTVGGEELVKTITDDGGALAKVAPRRITNLAKLYAWCVAKDVLSLTIFKPVPFGRPKPQTIIFLRHFFTSLFISSQSTSPALILKTLSVRRDREALEMVFVKAAPHNSLVKGLTYFLDEMMEEREEKSEKEELLMKWAGKVARETLGVSSDIIVR